MSDRLLARALEIAGDAGLRCLVSYRAIAVLAHDRREGEDSRGFIRMAEGLLDRLGAPEA